MFKSSRFCDPHYAFSANYIQHKSSFHGLIVVNPQVVQGSHAFVLNGSGGPQLKQFGLTTALREPHNNLLYFSYVRSHAIGRLNDRNNYLANFAPALVLPNSYTALPGDVLHRFLAWSVLYFPGSYS